jgi:hypothetical protein
VYLQNIFSSKQEIKFKSVVERRIEQKSEKEGNSNLKLHGGKQVKYAEQKYCTVALRSTCVFESIGRTIERVPRLVQE